MLKSMLCMWRRTSNHVPRSYTGNLVDCSGCAQCPFNHCMHTIYSTAKPARMSHTHWKATICCSMLPIWLALLLNLPEQTITVRGLVLGTGTSTSAKSTSKNSTFVRRVPSSVRVEGSYFVHMKHGSSWKEMEEIVQELERMDSNQSLVNFTATVHGMLTQAAFGFPAWLSDEALQKVRGDA